MQENLMDSVAPVLSAPVERGISTTVAVEDDGVEQSVFGITTGFLTFADEGDE